MIRLSRLIAALATSVLLLVGTSGASAAIKVMGPEGATAFQGDSAHDGHVAAAQVTLPYRRIWSIPVSGASYPIIAQGMVIVTTSDPNGGGKALNAYNASTGREVWSHPLGASSPSAGSFANATYENGSLFVVGVGRAVQAINAATGASEWTQLVDDNVLAAPTAAGATVYVATQTNTFALSEPNGTIVWKVHGGGLSSSPAIYRDQLYVTAGCSETWHIQLNSMPGWDHKGSCSGGGGVTDAVWNHRVYVRDANQGLILDDFTGEAVGAFSSQAIPAFDDAEMFGVTNGSLQAFGLQNGAALWSSDTALDIVTPPLVFNGWVVAGASDGHVYAFDKKTGLILWKGDAGTQISGPDEHDSVVLNGLGAAGPLLVVPGVDHLVAFRAKGQWTVNAAPYSGGLAASAPPTQPIPTQIKPSPLVQMTYNTHVSGSAALIWLASLAILATVVVILVRLKKWRPGPIPSAGRFSVGAPPRRPDPPPPRPDSPLG